MNIKKYKNIYLVGIGGIGMSALANYFYSQNKNVYGYDRVKSRLTENLEKKGIEIIPCSGLIRYSRNPASAKASVDKKKKK